MNINNFVDKIFCINLKERTDRREHMKKQAKKYNLNITYYPAVKHKKGWIGCLRSHLNIIKMAKKKKYKRILILEDDCKILSKFEINKKEIPKDWKILYLGANLTQILEDNQLESVNKKWVKMKCFTTHCMIINQSAYTEIINLIKKEEKPIDVYYKDNYQDNKKCYVINPMIATQLEGYSDIENKVLNYNLKTIEDTIEIPDAPHKIENGNYRLFLDNIKEKELPYISLLTPTKNRKKLFPLIIDCFNNFNYPKEKIEWIILDDSDNGDNLIDILPKDNRIKYKKLNIKKKLTISQKRNICVKLASHDILLNIDDDDYYFPNNLLARVKVLLSYPDINMVGCGVICCYDILKKNYFLSGNKSRLAEATMTFRRKFWEEKKFNNNLIFAEGDEFILNRKKECYRIPFGLVMCVINHNKNITINKRVAVNKSYIDYYKLPNNILNILEKIHN